MSPNRISLAAALFSVGFSAVFFIDLCNLIFQCGCDHLWAGADARCNIHSPTGRHCPWCSMSLAGSTAGYFGIAIPQFILAFHPRRWTVWRRLGLALAAFPLIGGLEGVALGLATGYWYS
jgi:hypothetical protein